MGTVSRSQDSFACEEGQPSGSAASHLIDGRSSTAIWEVGSELSAIFECETRRGKIDNTGVPLSDSGRHRVSTAYGNIELNP